MVRSSAKNHGYVACLTDPADYAELLAELDALVPDRLGGLEHVLRHRRAVDVLERRAVLAHDAQHRVGARAGHAGTAGGGTTRGGLRPSQGAARLNPGRWPGVHARPPLR